VINQDGKINTLAQDKEGKKINWQMKDINAKIVGKDTQYTIEMKMPFSELGLTKKKQLVFIDHLKKGKSQDRPNWQTIVFKEKRKEETADSTENARTSISMPQGTIIRSDGTISPIPFVISTLSDGTIDFSYNLPSSGEILTLSVNSIPPQSQISIISSDGITLFSSFNPSSDFDPYGVTLRTLRFSSLSSDPFNSPQAQLRGVYLGVVAKSISKKIKEENNIEGGVIVEEVVKDSPAEKAGFKKGDIIIEIENKKINTPEDIRKIVDEYSPGSTLKVKVIREKKIIELLPRLEEK
jgi:hypothetical protein